MLCRAFWVSSRRYCRGAQSCPKRSSIKLIFLTCMGRVFSRSNGRDSAIRPPFVGEVGVRLPQEIVFLHQPRSVESSRNRLLASEEETYKLSITQIPCELTVKISTPSPTFTFR